MYIDIAYIVTTGLYTNPSLVVRAALLNGRAPGSNGLGVFYWGPQGYPGWQGYTMGAMDASGKFSVAMDPFKVDADVGQESGG